MSKRLIKVANELNVATSTIVEFLRSRGLNVDNRPTAKLSPEMENLVRERFAKALIDRAKADALEFNTRPSSVSMPPKRKKTPYEIAKARIRQCKNDESRRLDLRGLGLTKIPKEIESLILIEEIYLTDNKIEVVSEEFKLPASVKILDISNNALEALVIGAGENSALEVLDVHENRLSYVGSLTSFSKMRSINLSFNQLESIDFLNDNISLRTLLLRNNQVTEIPPFLFKDIKLETLDLSHNLIADVSYFDLTSSKTIRHFEVTGNKITNIPVEIFDKEGNRFEAILDYFVSVSQGEDTDKLYEAKLIVIGNGGVGKSSLVDSILESEDFKVDKESTEGIDITSWNLNVEDVILEGFNTKRVKVNVWDFGGQEIYRSTHQFFLTKRSLYIFVWDARVSENYFSFSYWLNIINTLASESPIIVVMNKADVRSKEIDTITLKLKYKNIVDFIKVSCKTKRGVKDLQFLIKDSIVKLDHIGDKWSNKRIAIKEIVEKIESDYVDYDYFHSICIDNGLSVEEIPYFVEQLHDLGTFMHFKNNDLLKSLIIINPEWATDAVYFVLDDEKAASRNGKLTLADYKRAWKNETKYNNMFMELIALMQEFKLCFNTNDGTNYIVPQLLSASAVNYDPFEDSNTYEVIYSYKFMPAGIIEYFICDNSNLIVEDSYWKYGCILQFDPGTRALVFISPLESSDEIIVRIEGGSKNKKNKALTIIENSLNKINKRFDNLGLSTRSRCNCNCAVRCYFSAEMIDDFEQFGIRNVRCKQRQFEYRLVPIDFLSSRSLNNDVVRQCQELIEQGKIDEAFVQLKDFVEANESLNDDYNMHLSLLISRFSKISQQESSGVASDDDISLRRNKLCKDLLDYIKNLQSMEYD